mmetsp:Transcript_66081/g.158050  ORF Transcript_66081/g.158050 Transcript_66081/m.158050 type:complete len:449 (+) Transcript_66081:58-1404(+)
MGKLYASMSPALRGVCAFVGGVAFVCQLTRLPCRLHKYFNGESTSLLQDETLNNDMVVMENSSDDFALFTHDRKELHCMERELRHPCVSELRTHLADQEDAAAKGAALDCVRDVLDTTDDYWVLKNMTHLLLDLDTVDHVFDKESRTNEFVMLGIEFAQKLIKHDTCLQEFDLKGDLECRCYPLYNKIMILKLKNAKLFDEAKEVFNQATSFSWSGDVRQYGPGEAVPWDSWQHTPQIWVPELRSMQVWPRETWDSLPITHQLESNYETILEETKLALQNESSSGFEDAYRFLYQDGEWNRVLLYHEKKFTQECEVVFPKTCALLKQWLPSKPGLPWTSDQNEQVMVIKMKKGTDVEVHSGPANNILNIHMGLTGLKGAKLIVADQTYEWEEGKVIAWDGSYDHRVHCLECEEDRVIIMVRYMHPDMSEHHYRGRERTHFEEVPLELQ